MVSQELDLRIGINKTGVQDTKLAPGKARGYKWRARFELFLTNTIADDTNIHYAIAPTRGFGRSNFMRRMSANHSAMLAVTNPDSNYVSYNAHKIIIFTVPSECEVGYVACVEHLKSGTLPRKCQKFQSEHCGDCMEVVCMDVAGFEITRCLFSDLENVRSLYLFVSSALSVPPMQLKLLLPGSSTLHRAGAGWGTLGEWDSPMHRESISSGLYSGFKMRSYVEEDLRGVY